MTLAPRLPVAASPAPRDPHEGGQADDAELLLRPGRVGPLRASCRVILPAMETNLATRNGFVTERLVDYYRARAEGGVGWITVENTAVLPSGLVAPKMLRLHTDAHGEAFAPLVEAVHAAGSRLLVQLSHAGRQTLSDTTGEQPWAPSAVPCPVMKEEPRALGDDDIEALIAAFVAAAVRVQRAGADGVELHMAHGYLLCGLLSPDQNRRDDRWGGDTARRCAAPTAILRGIRAACGDDFAVIARFSADEFVEGGIDLDEALRIAPRLVAAGAHALHVSASNYESAFWNIPSYFLPEAPFVELAARVKEVVDVPIIAVGRLHRPEVAADVLRRGAADFVAIGRGLIAEPRWVALLRAGQRERIRPCLACNRCIDSLSGSLLECSVNPHVGFEGRDAPRQDAAPDDAPRVLIVGAGPAGLGAAQAAVSTGHRVRLVERRREVGGQLDLASAPQGKEPVGWYLGWLRAWLTRAQASGAVELRLGAELSVDDLVGAERVIWAGGSAPIPRNIEGDESIPRLPLDEAMRHPQRAGDAPLVLGGGAGGCEAAVLLAHGGAAVTLVEAKRKIARDLTPSLRYFLRAELREAGVRVIENARSLALRAGGASITVRRVGEVELDRVSAVVLAAGRAGSPVPAELAVAGEVEVIGDAVRPASIYEALQAGATLFR